MASIRSFWAFDAFSRTWSKLYWSFQIYLRTKIALQEISPADSDEDFESRTLQLIAQRFDA